MTEEQPTLRIAEPVKRRPALPRKIALTREKLAAIKCPPGKDRVTVYDSRTLGLMYVVYQTGRVCWYWYGRVKGYLSPTKHLIGGPEYTIEQARQRATHCLMLARAGINPNVDRRERAAQSEADQASSKWPTIGHLWETYRREFLEVRARASTRRGYESLYRTWIAPLASRPARSITADDLRAHHAAIARGRVRVKRPGRGNQARVLGGKRTANKVMAVLRRLFNYAKIEHPIQRGAIEWFREHSRSRYLTPPELKRFWAALADEPDETSRDFLTLCLFTGARKNNVLSMRWDELDADLQTWRVPKAKVKADDDLVIPLAPPAVDLLKRRRRAAAAGDVLGEYVLRRPGKSGHMVEPKYAWQRVTKKAGLRDIVIHDLRRTLGSWQAAMNASLPIIGRSLGHKSQSSTAIYARINLDPVRASMGSAIAEMVKHRPKQRKGGASKKSK